MSTLTTHGLCVGHGDRTVVAGAELTFSPGRCTAIVGANGSGKSTLLRTVAGLAAPLGGEIRLGDRDLAALRARELARQLAFLPQAPLVPAGITVAELVALGRHPHRRLLGGPTPGDDEAIAEAMAQTGLEDLAERPVDQLSGGERQRVWIAVALAQQAPVLLLDEPTTFLDIRHQLEVLALARQLCDEGGRTVVAVLHDLNQAAAFADQLVVVGDGRILAQGPPGDVLSAELLARAFGVHAEVHLDDEARPTCRFHAALA
ncbi:MAG TPA: ABC transporter ATP-binding protein [Acidimicrobiales bacterium]|nr:ABC transporter ATP-binding protein [Acidimicrobiales bacterium]